MSETLNTGLSNVKNVSRYSIGKGSFQKIAEVISSRREKNKYALCFIDQFFQDKLEILSPLGTIKDEKLIFVSTIDEPSTEYINSLVDSIKQNQIDPFVIIGIGGGITMDIAKAVSNLLTNNGKAEDYQGWDLVEHPGIYKVGIPTISGTGSEATRTCVMTNKKSGLKLGMNSDHTVFDELILDPSLTSTVPDDQYFYTGMDAYIHCLESLNGSYRNAIGDAYSHETISLCREVFLSPDMKSEDNRSKLMVASYLGGCAIATSYVGIVHPFSAGLSVVLGVHHTIGNCIVMRAMKEFYGDEYKEFWEMVKKQNISIPQGVCLDLEDEQYEQLYLSTIVHEKPLTNALGDGFKEILTRDKVKEVFLRM